MNQPNGYLFVDPEGVQIVGLAYGQYEDQYQAYVDWLVAVRTSGAAIWGDDDMGVQFAESFVAGVENLERLIGGVIGLLAYTSNGLLTSGRLYRQIDDDANEWGHQLAVTFATAFPPGTGPGNVLAGYEQPQFARIEAPLASRRLLARGQRLEGRHLPAEPGEGQPPTFMRSLRSVEMPLANGVKGPGEGVSHPLLSSSYSKPEFATVQVGGKPLPAGYRVVAMNPLADDAVYLDVNHYESVMPVDVASVTTPNGQPIDPGTGMLFVVKESPYVDPTAPGYEPLVIRYPRHGAPSVVTTGL